MKKGALVMLLIGLGAFDAFGSSILMESNVPVRWDSNSIPLQLNEAGSDDISGGADIQIISDAMSKWNAISCSTIQIADGGSTTERETVLTTGEIDGVNRLTWIEDSTWPFGQFVLAMTMPVWGSDGVIVEADIAFNGSNITWGTSFENDAQDLESIITHELGHFIGLQHILGGEGLADPPTMSVTVDLAERSRDLHADDIAGACFLYPASAYACSHQCDCPFVLAENSAGEEVYEGQLTCSTNTCGAQGEPFLGNGGLGAACARTVDCGSAMECVSTEIGAYCASSCTVGASSCPTGFSCYETNAGSGVCLADSLASGQGSNIGACLAGNTWVEAHQWGTYDSGCGCGASAVPLGALIGVVALLCRRRRWS